MKPQPAQARFLAVLNVTAHPSTASVPITVLLYNGPLLCGFNVPIKGLLRRVNNKQSADRVVFVRRESARLLGYSSMLLTVCSDTQSN